MPIPGKYTRVRVMNTEEPVPFNDQATTADANNKVYTITDRTKKYWSADASITVKVNGTEADKKDYLVQRAGGKIRFRDALEPGDVVTVSGEYVTVSTAALVHESTRAINNSIDDTSWFEPTEEEDPEFGGDGAQWRKRSPNLGGATGTLTGFLYVDSFLSSKMLSGKPVVIEIEDDIEDNASTIFAVYAVLENEELSASIESQAGNSVTWQSTGPLLTEPK